MKYLRIIKKFLTAFSLVGAAILTWLSIIAAPPLWEMLKTKKAEIVVAPLECNINEYCFMVSNIGNRPAVLTDIYGFNKESPGAMGVIPNKHKNKVIKPNEVFVIKALIASDVPPMLPYELHSDRKGAEIRKNCKARFQFIQYYAEEEFTEVEFVCFDNTFLAPAPMSHNKAN